MAGHYGLDGKLIQKYYKENPSDFREWDQLSHAEDYILFPKNLSYHLCIDETVLTSGELYTILSSKKGHGRKLTFPQEFGLSHKNISTNWNEAVFIINNESSKIVFDTDRKYQLGQKKEPDILRKGNISTRKISSSSIFENGYGVIYEKKNLKKFAIKSYVTIIIPVSVGDNKKEYRFDFAVSYKK